MLVMLVMSLVLTLFIGVIGLLPFPSLPDLAGFGSAVESVFSLIPQAFGFVGFFLGPTCMSLVRLFFQFYQSLLVLFGACIVFALFRGLFSWVKGWLPV